MRRFRDGSAILFATAVVFLQATSISAAITAAFVDFSTTPFGAALEAKLLATSDVKWVERSQLDLLLKEKRLQTAFAPEGAAARLELGKLLHADVLVLLRKQATSTSSDKIGYDLVICETRRGLRTTSLALTESKTQSLDAAKLAPTLLERVQRSTQEIRFVYTVPPLIGRDLSYRYSHLQRGFAELLTQRLLALPGTAVVESAEARAIAAERVIAGNPAGQADYAAPIFVTGEFRHSGESDAQRVRIQLTARRGEAAVGTAFDRELVVGEVAPSLTAWIDEIAAAGANNAGVPPVDRDAEAKRLFERGREFLIWDNLEEAWALAEAGLLYRPDDLALRRLAFDAVSEIFHRYVLICRVKTEVWPPLRIAFLRTCDHLEFLARHDGKMSISLPSSPYWSQSFFGTLRSVRPPSVEARAIHDELSPIEAEMLVKFYHIRVERGFHADGHQFLARYLSFLPPDKKHSEMVRHILEYPKSLDGLTVIPFIIHGQFSWTHQDLNPKLAILRELKTHTDRPELVALVTRLEAETLRTQASRAEATVAEADRKWADLNPPGAPFREIQWQIRRATQRSTVSIETLEPVPLDRQALWLTPIGPRLDIAQHNLGIFLVREPGLLDPLWETDLTEPLSSQEPPCYDGRYLWTMTIGTKRGILVVDPSTGKAWRSPKDFGITDDVPGDDLRAHRQSWTMMTPLGPGEVFAVATSGRSLLAKFRFDPQAAEPFSSTTVYECPESLGGEVDAWRNPKVSFKPTYLTPLPSTSDGTQPPKRILIGRDGLGSRSGILTINSKEIQDRAEQTGHPPSASLVSPPFQPKYTGSIEHHPLLLDLATNRVEVVEAAVSPAGLASDSTGLAVAGHEVFFTFRSRVTVETLKYLKYDVAGGKTTLLDADSPTGFVFFTGDETHIVGAHWWKKKPGDPKFTRVTPTVPWTGANLSLSYGSKFDVPEDKNPPKKLYSLQRLYNSAHYGPVLLLRGVIEKGGRARYHYAQLDMRSPMTGRP